MDVYSNSHEKISFLQIMFTFTIDLDLMLLDYKAGSAPRDPFLLIWVHFNPSMDKYSHAKYSVGWNYLSMPKLQRLYRWSLVMDK